MRVYNSKGVFHNADDDLAGLHAALNEHFDDVQVTVRGCVGLLKQVQGRLHVLDQTRCPEQGAEKRFRVWSSVSELFSCLSGTACRCVMTQQSSQSRSQSWSFLCSAT